jgi:hypothetical protein
LGDGSIAQLQKDPISGDPHCLDPGPPECRLGHDAAVQEKPSPLELANVERIPS